MNQKKKPIFFFCSYAFFVRGSFILIRLGFFPFSSSTNGNVAGKALEAHIPFGEVCENCQIDKCAQHLIEGLRQYQSGAGAPWFGWVMWSHPNHTHTKNLKNHLSWYMDYCCLCCWPKELIAQVIKSSSKINFGHLVEFFKDKKWLKIQSFMHLGCKITSHFQNIIHIEGFWMNNIKDKFKGVS